jgi:glycosyltransferase involved in cell wall biosynthesis
VPELVVLTEQLLADVPGGTGRYTAQLATALARTAPDGWTVSGVVARHADPRAAELPGVAGPQVLPLPRRALVAAWRAGLPLWPGGDAVHAPTPLAPPPRRGRSLTVTVHDTVAWTHPETLTPRGVAWHRKMIAAATARADAVVVPTRAVAGELARFAPGRAPVEVIGNGVSREVLTGDASVSGLPERYVLALGTVEPRKGLDVLIEAMASAGAPHVPVLIAGQPGWGGVDLTALAERHGLRNLRLLGRLTDAELACVLRHASVLAVPSLAEGFGLGLLEAMAAGVPVVHSDAPALVEVAAGAGVTVPRGDTAALANALRRVVEHRQGTTHLVEAGKRQAARFTWEAAARAVWKLHTRSVRE